MAVTAPHAHWDITGFDATRCAPFSQALNIPPLLAHLLLLRGVNTVAQMRDFLRPALSHLSDPFDLSDMGVAVDRILRARERGESVLVFGDYDVDGISATAILTRALRRFGITRVGHDMPDRFAEGYGLAPERIDRAAEEGYALVITVDNGISAHEAAQRAREKGVDLIITDHHALDGPLPEAVAVINPKRDSPDHPAAMLAGAGVALKVSIALNGTPNDLDIAALGTVSDIVPLLRENRVIVALGLKHMMRYNRVGLASLARTARFDLNSVNAQKIGFQLGPRLNAAGRLDTGHTALELLMTECAEQASALAVALNRANEERRAIEQNIYEQAEEILEAFLTDRQRSIVLSRDDWHQGVIGIVASRVQTRYRRPVIICCRGEDGLLHGSGRSTPNFNLVEALSECRHHLLRFGGHAAAAGVTLAPESLDAFRESFEEVAVNLLGDEPNIPTLHVDALVSLSQLDMPFMNLLDRMEPFGMGNPEPALCAVGVDIVPHSLRILKEAHLKFAVRQNDTVLEVIGFRMAERFFTEALPEKVDIVFSPQLNTYNNATTIQLVLKDMRVAS